ncbi:MAG: hypothetical protein HQK53_05640 [Oligoflexia bacterium]|nr:hypothetical protein [Oligoflexia bacterium]
MKRKFMIVTTMLFLLSGFTACIHSEIPELDRSTNILGPDEDHNGIRDDLDKYIHSLQLSLEEKKAVQQDARAYQNVMTIDPTNLQEAKKAKLALSKSMNCTHIKIIDQDKARSIHLGLEKYTANTKERTLQYIRYCKTLSGSTWKLLEGDTCEN